MFELLDLDGNKKLDYSEIVGVLHGRQRMSQGKEEELKQSLRDGLSKFIQQVRDRTGF